MFFRSRWLIPAVFVLLAGWHSQARCDFITPASLQAIGVHPDAQLQSTAEGRTLANITPFNDELYFGYGDWSFDTGPISIRSLNPTTATWSAPLLNFGTEAVLHYRAFSGKLYAPNIDPRGLPGVNPGGFAVGVPSSGGTTWSQVDNVAATHVFDIVSRNGNEIWMAGSVGVYGGVWRSTDGGQSFSTERLDGPALGSPGNAFSRYEGAAVFNNELYVQRRDANGASVTNSLVFDGTDWSSGPNLLLEQNTYLWRPATFKDELVYLNSDRALANLYRFDGTQAVLAYSGQLKDYFLTDEYLYALTASGELVATSDLDTWDLLGTVPSDASSLAVVGNQLYIGNTNSTVFQATLTHFSAVPEPTSMFLIGCVAAISLAARGVRNAGRARRSKGKR